MNDILVRLTSAAVAITIPLSSLAYSAEHFKVEIDDIPLEIDELSEKEQRQIWDTQCREKLGIPGGDVIGALRANLNRCINSKKRQVALGKRQRRQTRRIARRIRANIVDVSEGAREIAKERSRKAIANVRRQRTSLTSSLPKTRREIERSVRASRAAERAQIRKLERRVTLTERSRAAARRKARKMCVHLVSLERAECIREKVEEILKSEK